MTRINCGIPVEELCKEHLLAEHREIKRIPNCIKKGRYSMKGQPDQFTLGEGHVKFFYDKLQYLYERYIQLYNRCIEKKLNVTAYHDAFYDVPQELFNYYEPTDRDRQIVRERIAERITKMKRVTYFN